MIHELRIIPRIFRSRPLYTAINAVGMSIGIAVALLLMILVRHETSYDRHIPDSENVYRIVTDRTFPTGHVESAASPRPLSLAIGEGVPGVAAVARFSTERASSVVVNISGKRFTESGFRFADAAIGDIAGLELLSGENRLDDPFNALLTESAASRYFGSQNPVGQRLRVRLVGDRDEFEYLVTGVVADPPSNSHLTFTTLASYSGHPLVGSAEDQENWLGLDVYTYVRLEKDANARTVEAAVTAVVKPEVTERVLSRFPDASDSGSMSFVLEPVTSIHLSSNRSDELGATGSWSRVQLLALIGLFILAMACANFVNLTTARATERFREIGVRKTFGSTILQLRVQFLTESILFTGVATALGIGLAETMVPWFSSVLDTQLSIPYGSLLFIPGTIAFVVLLGMTAGMYPAFVMSRPTASDALAGRIPYGAGAVPVRSTLVGIQLALAFMLIAGTLTLNRQLSFMSNLDLGFESSQVVYLEGADVLGFRLPAVRASIEEIPGVLAVGNGQTVPGGTLGRTTIGGASGSEDIIEVAVDWLTVGAGYLESLSIATTAGRTFMNGNAQDSMSVILNLKTVDALNMSDPVGKLITENDRTYTIIGVIDDVKFNSLHNTTSPLVLFGPDPFSSNRPNQLITVRMEAGTGSASVEALKDIWNAHVPDAPLSIRFLDDRLQAQYETENAMQEITAAATLLALFIAGLGMLGLTMFAVRRRRRELAVRMVFGASTLDIVRLLTTSFSKPMFIALVVAMPSSWILAGRWLDSFAFRAPLEAELFIGAILIGAIAAALPLIGQAVLTARMSPAHGLRE